MAVWKSIRHVEVTPKIKSVIGMALAIAFHFAGYEFARSSILAMFTSKRTGFSSPSALSFATGCVAPFAFALLWLYTRILDTSGPRKVLRYSTLLSSAILFVGGLILSTINTYLEDDGESSSITSTTIYHQISKGTLWIMFVLQNAFVQILYTQHWSFLGSIQTSEEAAVRFAPIAGVGSIFSTIAACLVSPLVECIGLTGLLYCAALGIGISAVCADWAYNFSEKHGFEPKGGGDAKGNSKTSPSTVHSESFISRARILFRRVPILGAICVEELSYHGLSSVVNFLFMAQAKLSILDDKSRASWTGYSYAIINGASGMMQFLVLPLAVKYIDPKHIFMINPAVMLVCTILLLGQIASPIYMTTATLVVLKTMEYSLRGLAHELVRF